MTLRVAPLESIKLTLSSYGPFEELELNLTPLTIITGPNAVGKSFLMRAVYAMLATPTGDPLPASPEGLALC